MKKGDIVKLNSGSPDMMVMDFNCDGEAVCSFVNDDGEIIRHEFPIKCLTIQPQ